MIFDDGLNHSMKTWKLRFMKAMTLWNWKLCRLICVGLTMVIT